MVLGKGFYFHSHCHNSALICVHNMLCGFKCGKGFSHSKVTNSMYNYRTIVCIVVLVVHCCLLLLLFIGSVCVFPQRHSILSHLFPLLCPLEESLFQF